MRVETAPSIMPPVAVEITPPAANLIADTGSSLDSFSPQLNFSILTDTQPYQVTDISLELDKYIPGEIVRDFTTEEIRWAPQFQDERLVQDVGNLENIIDENTVSTVYGEYTAHENYSARIEPQPGLSDVYGEIRIYPHVIARSEATPEAGEARMTMDQITTRVLNSIYPNASVMPRLELKQDQVDETKVEQTEAVTQNIAHKVDQEASVSRLEIAKKALDQASLDGRVSGHDLHLPEETELVRSRLLSQLGRYFDPDGAYREFVRELRHIPLGTLDEVLEQISAINSVLPPVELGGRIDEVNQTDVARVLGRSSS